MLIIKMIMMMTLMTYYHVVQGTPCSSGPAAKVARDMSAASISVIVIVISIVIGIFIAIVINIFIGIFMLAIITILIIVTTMVTISSPWDTRSWCSCSGPCPLFAASCGSEINLVNQEHIYRGWSDFFSRSRYQQTHLVKNIWKPSWT